MKIILCTLLAFIFRRIYLNNYIDSSMSRRTHS